MLFNVELKFKHRQSVLFTIILCFPQKEHWNDCYKTRLLNLPYNNGMNLRVSLYLAFHCSCILNNLWGGGVFYKLKSVMNSRLFIYNTLLFLSIWKGESLRRSMGRWRQGEAWVLNVQTPTNHVKLHVLLLNLSGRVESKRAWSLGIWK